jgi:hypothetical protein
MDLKKLAFSLTLGASLFAGCGDDNSTTTTTSTSTTTTTTTTAPMEDFGMCGDAGTPILYRINELIIPTPAQANGGETVGHNVDGAGDVCGVPDYAGGVDNSLVDLAAALPSLAPSDPIDLQAEIDAGLNCAPDATDCTRIDLIVTVATGTNCVVVEVLDGTDANATSLAGPFVGSLNSSGEMRGVVPSLQLAIPYGTETGPVDINLAVTSVIITGTRTDTTLTDIVIGGALIKTDFETTIRNLLPLLGDSITFDDIGPILSNLYDVQVAGATPPCAALSVGLTGSAAVVTP